MSTANTYPAVGVPTVTPCVCCRERPHAHVPDPDLEGYVCSECGRRLARVSAYLADAEIKGCVPEPPATR